MTTIYSIMVKMAAPVTEHCSKAPRTRKIYVMEKTNGMKPSTNVIITGGNSIFVKVQLIKTVIRLENIDYVYMLMGSYVLLSRTEVFNVMVYIFAQFAFLHLKMRWQMFYNLRLVNKIQQ